MEAIIVPAIVFTAIVAIVKIVADHRTRNRLIEKGQVNENLRYLFTSYSDRVKVRSNLKWGFVFLGIGVGLMAKQVSPIYISDETAMGLMFLLAGIGFFVYYYVAKGQLADSEGTDPDQKPPRP